MALCTQADIEKLIQVDITAEPEPQVTFLIENAQAMIESHCHRIFEAAVGIVETLDARGASMLYLKQTPVTGITSVVEDTVALVAADYAFYPNGRVVRIRNQHDINWTHRRQAIVITYDGGFATVPFDIRMVCASVAAEAFKTGAAYAAQGSPGVKLERIGDYMIQYDLDAAIAAMELTMADRKVLANYRRVVLV